MDDDQDTGLQQQDNATLDPPGSIAVVGAGPLGVEAALYGRFLGYDVTLLERRDVGHAMSESRDQPLPMLPDRCLSPLAQSAIQAQAGDSGPRKLPESVGQWIDEGLRAVLDSDLLADRLRVPADVTRIELVDAAVDGEKAVDPMSDTGDVIPPDFQLTICEGAGEAVDERYEAVILAIGYAAPPEMPFDPPVDYLFRIGEKREGNAEENLRQGLREIVSVFSQLAGRTSLDLYRPARL